MSQQPYIGLRPFERTETDIFFGRETHTDELIDRLGASHFLAVVGTSGCGKSSLVKTGLIAGLEAGYLAKASTHWRIVEMRPSNQPFQALAAQLFSELKDVLAEYYTVDSLRDTLQQGSLSLHELLAQHPLPNNAQLLIVCDQFEEIFRYFQQGASAEARNFVSLLLASSTPYPISTTQLSDFVYVVITMRSDFLGDCAQFAGLAEAINQGLYLTPRLNAQQLRAAIEEPAFVFNGEIEPALITQLLEDAQTNQDQLPLLQHVLMRLWDRASDKPATLTLADYQAIGGLSDALSGHADEVYNQLSNKQQRLAELLFRSLTERGDAQRDTRRPTPLADIIELTASSFAEVVAVIDAFRQTGCCFLMPPINVALTSNSIIDISHESLIRQWQRLQDWTADEVLAAEKYQRLQITASRYAHKEAALLQSPELEMLLQWQKTFKPTPLWAKRYGGDFKTAMDFLQKSAKRRRLKRVIFVVLFIFMSVLAGVATWGWKQAEIHKQKALKQKQLAEQQKAQTEIQKQAALKQQKIAEQQKNLVLVVIDKFTYKVPEELAHIPNTGKLRAWILENNIRTLEKIYALNPDDKYTQWEISINLNKAGDLYLQLGGTKKALEPYSQALKIRERLAKQDLQDSEAQRNLSVSFEKLADVYLQLGDTQKALDYYQKSQKNFEQLAQQDPQNSHAQRDLFYSFQKLGDAYLKASQNERSLAMYQKSFDISDSLVKKDSSNNKEKGGLAEAYEKLGDVYLKLKHLEKAKQMYEQTKQISQKLVNDDAQNSYIQRELLMGLCGLANTDKALKNLKQSRTYLQQALPIAEKLAEDKLNQQAQQDLKQVRAELAILAKK